LRVKVFCGIDWAEAYHDVALVDADGAPVPKRRIDDSADGFAELLAMLADAGDTTTDPIPVVLPNQVPGWLLDHEKPATPDPITVSWRGGKSHDSDFGELVRLLRTFLQHPRNRDPAELHCMSADYNPRVASNHGRTRWAGWHVSGPTSSELRTSTWR
jgi:hypothetical protein